jgi:ribonuclease BN (tRNA processing enzyme)
MARVTILGSGTCVPYARRGPAGYVLEGADTVLLIDSGSGTLGRLVQAGIDYRDLDAVLYTHTHPDHVADLAPLLFALNYTPGFERQAPLRLCGPPGFGGFLAGLEVLHPGIRPRSFALDLTEMDGSALALGGIGVTSQAVEHANMPALAYRLEVAGCTVVFSGDTSYCAGIVAAARGADLLVLEASSPFADRDPGPHLSAAMAGQVAREAGARRVVLTHQYPECDGHDMAALVGEHFAGEVVVGEDQMVLDVAPSSNPLGT